MLTPRQSALMAFIEQRIADGVPPSFEEMRVAVGLASRSGIHRMLGSLAERGFVSKTRGHRSLKVLRSLGDVAEGTPRSEDPLVLFIHRHQADNGGQTPSYRQMAQALGSSSTSYVSRRLAALHRQGAVVQSKEGRHRMIHVVKTAGEPDRHDA